MYPSALSAHTDDGTEANILLSDGLDLIKERKAMKKFNNVNATAGSSLNFQRVEKLTRAYMPTNRS